jgi:hypothetical protein
MRRCSNDLTNPISLANCNFFHFFIGFAFGFSRFRKLMASSFISVIFDEGTFAARETIVDAHFLASSCPELA